MDSSDQHRRGLCLILVGPSGSGETTVMNAVASTAPWLRQSVSATTRAPRSGERPGIDYSFLAEPEFEDLLGRGGFLEQTWFHEHSYGTLREPVEVLLRHGLDVGLVLDADGARAVRRALPDDVVSVFIMPPSIDALERRLQVRGDRPESLARRLASVQEEIRFREECDHVVLNESLDCAVSAVRGILRAAREDRESRLCINAHACASTHLPHSPSAR